MMWGKHALSLLMVLLLGLLVLGYPHGTDPWFSAFLNGSEDDWLLFKLYRLPEMVISLFAGAALATSGLLLQTTLNNPLAGPSILGITSGSYFFVALVLMGGTFVPGVIKDLSITLAATFGALAFGALILLISLRVKSIATLLIVGIMLSTLMAAITNIIVMESEPQHVKAFAIWGMGTLQQLNYEQIPTVTVLVLLILGLSVLLSKSLNALTLGDRMAAVVGVKVRRTRIQVLLLTSLLVGIITAFCGPIGFVGLIVPNLVKLYYKTAKHGHLMLASMLLGASVLLFCDLLIRILEPYIVLPINSLTAIFGAPIVLVLLLTKKNHA